MKSYVQFSLLSYLPPSTPNKHSLPPFAHTHLKIPNNKSLSLDSPLICLKHHLNNELNIKKMFISL